MEYIKFSQYKLLWYIKNSCRNLWNILCFSKCYIRDCASGNGLMKIKCQTLFISTKCNFEIKLQVKTGNERLDLSYQSSNASLLDYRAQLKWLRKIKPIMRPYKILWEVGSNVIRISVLHSCNCHLREYFQWFKRINVHSTKFVIAKCIC